MQYEEIKAELQRIVDLCQSIPEAYRDKCFEILFTAFLSQRSPQSAIVGTGTGTADAALATAAVREKIPTPAQVRVFMQRNAVTEAILSAVVLIAGGELHFIREPSPPTVAEGQIQWALLLALKAGILNNALSVDPEDVRSICQDKGFYDGPNFAAIFKRPSNAKLFKGTLNSQGEPRALTNEGEAELAKLLRALAGA